MEIYCIDSNDNWYLFSFVDELDGSDAVERALQISATLLTTPDNDLPPLDIPYLSNVKYLQHSRNPHFKSLSFPDSDLDDKINKEENKRLDEFLGKKEKKYDEFLGKRTYATNLQDRANLKRAMEFLGKRNMEFLGKRNAGSSDKRTMEFLGKRAMEFLGKRAMEFLGKRTPLHRRGRRHNRRAGDWMG